MTRKMTDPLRDALEEVKNAIGAMFEEGGWPPKRLAPRLWRLRTIAERALVAGPVRVLANFDSITPGGLIDLPSKKREDSGPWYTGWTVGFEKTLEFEIGRRALQALVEENGKIGGKAWARVQTST